MARDRKDRSASWFMEHHGGALLRLAHLGHFVRWQAAQTVLGFPKQIPDGLLDVTFPDKPAPDPFLIEIESYPEPDTLDQIRKDLAMVLLTRGVVPDILLLVLRPKGNLAISPEQIVASARGLTELRLKVHVVNLWTVPAEELLAAGDVGLIPWVPLARYDGPPEALLQECRQRIEQQGKPEEQDNLLAVTRVMAEARYNDPQLLSVLLGGRIMSFEKVLLDTPAGQRFLAERDRATTERVERETAQRVERETAQRVERETAQRVERETARRNILRLLKAHFGPVPDEVTAQLDAIQEQQKLDDLLLAAASCPDLQAFRQAISGP
jgi:hypothetical protein